MFQQQEKEIRNLTKTEEILQNSGQFVGCICKQNPLDILSFRIHQSI